MSVADQIIPDGRERKHERSGVMLVTRKGSGRIYTITVAATDASGNVASDTIDVCVPKSMGKCDD